MTERTDNNFTEFL